MWVAIVVLAAVILATRLPGRARFAASAIYGLYLLVAVSYIPFRARFHLRPPDCEWSFDLQLAVSSLQNYQHVVLCACFFAMTFVILRNRRHPYVLSGAATVAIGLLAELEEGAAHFHHCPMRDLIPDTAGALIAAAAIWIVRKTKARTI